MSVSRVCGTARGEQWHMSLGHCRRHGVTNHRGKALPQPAARDTLMVICAAAHLHGQSPWHTVKEQYDAKSFWAEFA